MVRGRTTAAQITSAGHRAGGGRWEVRGSRVLGDLHRLQQYALHAFSVLPLDTAVPRATASSAWQRDVSSSVNIRKKLFQQGRRKK